MGMFETTKTVPMVVPDLSIVAKDTMEYFRQKGFEVSGEKTITGGWYISLSKGNIFKSVLGMKTALNIEIEPSSIDTKIKAGVGIFGQQVLPSIITLFITWPVLIAQIWGMIQQSKLDDEAVEYIASGIEKNGSSEPAPSGFQSSGPLGAFCAECGTKLTPGMKFCPGCGTKQ